MSVLVSEGIGYANLSDDLEDEGPWKIHGVAIGAGDTTLGQSGIKKFWPGESLSRGASTLSNTPLVANHINNDVYSVVGEVLKSKFEEGVGVIYEGEIDEKELAKKVDRGRLDVSPRIRHENVEEMDENEDGARVVSEVEFVNLSLVPVGASPSASVETGSSSSLSAAELRKAFTEKSSVTESEDSEESEQAENTGNSEENLAQHEVHEPEFSGTREAPWSKPSLEDFTDESWDDLSSDEKNSIADHFIGSSTGFPPENFGDLFLPVVDSEGNLVLNALQNAKARVGQVSGLSDEDQNRAENIINRLAEGNFEDADFEDNSGADSDDEVDESLEAEENILTEISVLGVDDSRNETRTEDLDKVEILL